MRSPNFWSWFDGIAGPQLAHRTEGFRKVFDYLDRFDRPVGIVETGCVRQQDNWAGDGQSTILFDRYAEFHPGSAVFSVDRDPEAAALCRSLVGAQVQIHAGDSLAYLKSLADHPPAGLEFLDLLYLDSFDVDFDDPLPSAIHHLKELLAIAPLVTAHRGRAAEGRSRSSTAFPARSSFELRCRSTHSQSLASRRLICREGCLA